jgi:hypothetical protein
VDLGLAGEALEVLADRLVGIDDDLHLPRSRLELDQPGVDPVGVRADVQPLVEPLDDGEVALALGRRLLGDGVGGGLHPLRLRQVLLGAGGGGEEADEGEAGDGHNSEGGRRHGGGSGRSGGTPASGGLPGTPAA